MSEDLHDELAARLLQAHRSVGALPVSDDEKARWSRRLIALSDVAKSDAQRASVRLDALHCELDALLEGLHGGAESAGQQA